MAFTDALVMEKSSVPQEHQERIFRSSVLYAGSDEPVGTPISSDEANETCPTVSAGDGRHEYTTGAAYKHILAQFNYVPLNIN